MNDKEKEIANRFGEPDLAGRVITLNEARGYHINYLETGPHIIAKVGGIEKIVHSFFLDRQDLELLYPLADNGIRIYFCKDDAAQDYINLIAVPVGDDDHNDIRTVVAANNSVAIINTLEPCPPICPPAFSENDLNCRKKDGVFYWLRPNDITQDQKTWFSKGSPTPIPIPADKPQEPYEE